MRQKLLQNASIFLLQNATVFLQNAAVITNCDNCITNCDSYYKMRRLLQIATVEPVSVLPLLSKVFEKIIYDQLYECLENFLSELLRGFRKVHSTQSAFFRLIQKWQAELDARVYVSTILTDLSKAYDCLSHDLLIAKLEAYGLDIGSLNFLLDFISSRKHRTKVGSSYSKFAEGYPKT